MNVGKLCIVKLFGRAICLVTLGLIGQHAVAQSMTAKHELLSITPAELSQVDQRVRDCLADLSPGVLDSHYAGSSASGDSLQMTYAWQADGANRKVQFSAHFGRESSALDWQLGQILLGGEQVLVSQEQPVHFMGFLTDRSVESALAAASDLWSSTTGDPFQVSRIISSQTPPMYCETIFPDVAINETIYDVSLTNLAPQQRGRTTVRSNTASFGSSGAYNHSFSIRVARDSDGSSVTTDVNCDGGNSCDTVLLENLRSNLERPVSDSDKAARMSAVLAVVPKEFAAAVAKDSRPGLFGPVELFHVNFGEMPTSQNRREKSSVSCSRMAGSDMDWHCQHSRSSISQTVPGQSRPVSVMAFENLPEKEVESAVLALKVKLAERPEIDPLKAEIHVSTLLFDGDVYKSAFTHDHARYTANFTIDDGGDLQIESVELKQRWGEN